MAGGGRECKAEGQGIIQSKVEVIKSEIQFRAPKWYYDPLLLCIINASKPTYVDIDVITEFNV